MKRELILERDPIDEARLLRNRPRDPGAGAIAVFLGVVRDTEGEDRIEGLDYEAFVAMATHQFHLLFDEAERRWPLHSIRLAHRLGPVRAGDPSLWVEVTSPHRGEALAAIQWLIDEMKLKVPIWKRRFGTAPAGTQSSTVPAQARDTSPDARRQQQQQQQ